MYLKLNSTTSGSSPLPVRIEWSKVQNIQEVAEVVDGNWRLVDGGIRTAEPYYDRVIAIGDQSWTDYEVTTTVVFHSMLPDKPVSSEPYSHRAHASVVLRWKGHANDGQQPRVQWFPLGGLAMLRAGVEWSGNRWGWHGGESGDLAEEVEGRHIVLERPYRIKARVQTRPGPRTLYSVKSWEADRPEPPGWDLVARDGENDLQSGSLLLVAHHADVTFGDVEVVPIR